jgi:hypothetical protein
LISFGTPTSMLRFRMSFAVALRGRSPARKVYVARGLHATTGHFRAA